MSAPSFLSSLRSSDHDFVAALRFLNDYPKHIHGRGHHSQVYHHFVPRFDLEQHADTYELYGELAGFQREDIIIEAHDGHNLQVSGFIPAKTSQRLPSCESKRLQDVTGSSTKSKDQKAAEGAPNQEQPKPIQESTSPTKARPPVSASQATTTSKHKSYPTARFGDVLDPHAEFVHDVNDTKDIPAVTDTTPEVRYLIAERHPSSFHRAFHFPTPIKKDEVTATMQDGILHITAPRAPMPPPVKVPIEDDFPDYSGMLPPLVA
jgi:HSP20 family molecular chaperone IbpA